MNRKWLKFIRITLKMVDRGWKYTIHSGLKRVLYSNLLFSHKTHSLSKQSPFKSVYFMIHSHSKRHFFANWVIPQPGKINKYREFVVRHWHCITTYIVQCTSMTHAYINCTFKIDFTWIWLNSNISIYIT